MRIVVLTYLVFCIIIIIACSPQQEPQQTPAPAAPVDPLAEGLTAHLPLNGDFTVLGDSILAVPTGALRWTADIRDSLGMALELRGGWATIDSFPRPDSMSSFTVAAWIDGSDGAVFATEDYSLYCVYRRLAFGVPGSQEEFVRSRSPLLEGVWHMAAATYDADTGMMRLYLNGMLESERYTPLQTEGGRGEARVGYGVLPGGRESAFTGRVDDIRVWRRALSADELLRLYTSQWE